jgi:hypothetical protein
MSKHTVMGVFVGGIFAATIASIAALDGGGLIAATLRCLRWK